MSDQYVIQIIQLATGVPSSADGKFVLYYDPDAYGGRGDVQLTSLISQAKRYDSFMDAMNEWKRTSRLAPVRPDNKPNRPLTAYTIEVRRCP